MAHTASLSAFQSLLGNNQAHYAGFCSPFWKNLLSMQCSSDWFSLAGSRFLRGLARSPLGHPDSKAFESLAMRSSLWVFRAHRLSHLLPTAAPWGRADDPTPLTPYQLCLGWTVCMQPLLPSNDPLLNPTGVFFCAISFPQKP